MLSMKPLMTVCQERAMTRPKAAIIAVRACLRNSPLYESAPFFSLLRRRLSTSFFTSACCAFVKSVIC